MAVSASSQPQLQRATDDRELQERDFSAKVRKKAGMKGTGAYPIVDQDSANRAWDLRNNGRASEEEVVAHIRAKVKQLGLKMPSSGKKKNGKAKRTTESNLYIRVRELKRTAGGSYEATIIREGPGNPADRRFYTREALRKMVADGKCENLRCYADHPTPSEERERPERSIRQLVGRFENARFVEGKRAEVRANFVPIDGPGYEWVRSLIESAIESGGGLIGISIDGFGDAPDQQEIGGKVYDMVREVTHLGSADIVTVAGAGGKFISKLQESVRELERQVRDLRPPKPSKKSKTGKKRSVREKTSNTSKPSKTSKPSNREFELREQLKHEKRLRKLAESDARTATRHARAAKVLRENGESVGSVEYALWHEDLAGHGSEDKMRGRLDRLKAQRREHLDLLREAHGIGQVEGAGPRPPSGPPSDGNQFDLLERVLGRDNAAAFEDHLLEERRHTNGYGGGWR